MASLAYILSPKLSDRAVLTGSATVGNSPISNVQNSKPRSRAIFTSGSCFIEGDLGAEYPIDGFAVGFINSSSSSDTIQFRGKLTYPVTSSPSINNLASCWPSGSDLSAFSEIHKQMEVETAAVPIRYFRFDFNCATAVQLGRILVGKRVEPEHSVNAFSMDASEPIAATVDMGGQETRQPMGGARRSLHLEWPAVSHIESLGRIYELMLERGSARDYMVSLNHGEDIISPMAYVYLGYGQLKIPYATLTQQFSVHLDLVEMAPLRML